MYEKIPIPEVVRVSLALLVSLFCLDLVARAADSEQTNESRYTALDGSDYYAMDSGLVDNLRWALDISSRVDASTDTGETSAQNIAGLDLHKVFTGDQGDWGTLSLQLYMTRFDNQNPHPFFVEDDDDWELVPRISNFNYTGLAQGRFNVRVGHFEIPYGLEVPVNTNGTLRQVMTGPNLGLVVDWGVGINGTFPKFDYEVTLSRGSGVEYFDTGQPYIVAGRLGLPTRAVKLGFSGFAGQVAGATGITSRTRFGADLQWQHGPMELLGEVSVGEDEKQEVVNTYSEVNWATPDEAWTVYISNLLLYKYIGSSWDEATALTTGIRFSPNTTWFFSTQYQQDLSTFGTKNRDGIFSAQVRCRF